MQCVRLAIAALPLLAAAIAAPALAQDTSGPSTTYIYGSAGYTNHDVYGKNLGTVDGRLGSRWGWFGVEGEVSGGVNRANVTGGKAGINDQETLYGVVFLPIGHQVDLFGRIGYGRTQWDYKGAGHPSDDDRNWNVGGGGQWFWSRHDGVRAEYTRETFDHAPDSDTWSVSYVRKF